MADYRFTVGTGDPTSLSASSDAAAVQQAITQIESQYADDLRDNPQKVVTLMGPAGLVTRPSERVDEFVERLTGSNPAADPDTLQPGDSNSPDCNLD